MSYGPRHVLRRPESASSPLSFLKFHFRILKCDTSRGSSSRSCAARRGGFRRSFSPVPAGREKRPCCAGCFRMRPITWSRIPTSSPVCGPIRRGPSTKSVCRPFLVGRHHALPMPRPPPPYHGLARQFCAAFAARKDALECLRGLARRSLGYFATRQFFATRRFPLIVTRTYSHPPLSSLFTLSAKSCVPPKITTATGPLSSSLRT